MHLSKVAVKEFQRIYEKEFGEKISDKKAYESASNLLNLFELLYRIDKRENPKVIK